MSTKSKLLGMTLLLLAFVHPALIAHSQTGSPSSYDELISTGRALLKEGKLSEAYSAAMEAEKSNETRYESYALAALIFEHQNKPEDALNVLKDGIARAPETKKAKLFELQQSLEKMLREQSTQSAAAEEITAEMKRKLEVLKLILEDADHARTSEARRKYLSEYLTKSDEVLKTDPSELSIWLVRAAIAVETGDAGLGWNAGKKLIASNSSDPKIKDMLVQLERKDWLGDRDPAVVETERRESETDSKRRAVQKLQEDLRKSENARRLELTKPLEGDWSPCLGYEHWSSSDPTVGKGVIKVRILEDGSVRVSGKFEQGSYNGSVFKSLIWQVSGSVDCVAEAKECWVGDQKIECALVSLNLAGSDVVKDEDWVAAQSNPTWKPFIAVGRNGPYPAAVANSVDLHITGQLSLKERGDREKELYDVGRLVITPKGILFLLFGDVQIAFERVSASK